MLRQPGHGHESLPGKRTVAFDGGLGAPDQFVADGDAAKMRGDLLFNPASISPALPKVHGAAAMLPYRR